MNDTTIRALLGRPSAPELALRRVYRTDAADLRSAFVERERLARWLGAVDPLPRRMGDTFVVALGEDPDDVAHGTILRCDDTEISATWHWQDERESVVSARFVPRADDRTELILRHALTEEETTAEYGGGWERLLQDLARAVDGADPSAPSGADLEPTAQAAWRTLGRFPFAIEQRVGAPVERVWEAFTTPAGLSRWWWNHWDDVEIEADARPGGRYSFHVPSQGIELRGTYLVVEEPRRLAFSWEWADADGTVSDESVDIRLRRSAGATMLSVRHSGPWQDDAPAEQYRLGWESTLAQLSAAVTGG